MRFNTKSSRFQPNQTRSRREIKISLRTEREITTETEAERIKITIKAKIIMRNKDKTNPKIMIISIEKLLQRRRIKNDKLL
jgi:hypothetical protein